MTLFLTAIGPVFYKLVYMSLTGLAAGAIVLLLRRLADKRFSPVWKYAMWLLVLAALVVPWRPQSRAAVLSPAEAVQDISFREEYSRAQTEYSAVLAQAPQLPQVPPEVEATRKEAASLRVKSLAFDELLPLLWLCGMAGVAAFMGIAAIRLRRRVKGSELIEDAQRYEDLLERCKQQLGIKRRVRIVRQSYVGTPALLGLLRPVILLPEYAAGMSDARLEYVVLHELSHLKRGDSVINVLLLVLRAVYWFNPLVWLLFKFVREDMELVNDAAVLKGMGKEAQKEYSLSLVEVLAGCGKQRHTMLCMTDGKKNIERRISMIQLGDFFKKRKWIIAVVGILVIATVAALFLTVGIKRNESYDAPAAYRPLLEGIYKLVQTAREEDGDWEWLGEPGMEDIESQNLSGTNYTIEGNMGYAIVDINSDNTPELLWLGKSSENPKEILLYALFTLKDNAPVRLFSREPRNTGILEQDGTLYCIASTAMETILTSHRLEPGADTLSPLTEYRLELGADALTQLSEYQQEENTTATDENSNERLYEEYTNPPDPLQFTFIPIETIAEKASVPQGNRYFPMQGPNLSDLQSDEIIRRIVEITGAADDNIMVPASNFGANVTGDFDWHMDNTIAMTLTKKGLFGTRGYGCQLRVNMDARFYVTDTSRTEASGKQYKLKDYLDALKYLPQVVHGEWDLYSITTVEYEKGLDFAALESNDPSCIFYNKYGITQPRSDWQLTLQIQPMKRSEQNDSYEGVGSDTMHLFYVAEPEIPTLTPTFLPPGTGTEALKPLIWGSEGWWLDTQGDYIFAHFFRYLLRYDIKTNKIDKIIDLGDAPQSWWYASTYSPDGQTCVVQAQNFDGPGETGRLLIDLKNETVTETEQEHFSHSTQTNPRQVEPRLLEHGYGWFINDVEIKALRPYAATITEVIAIDENRVGALMPVSDEANGYLGYYKFAVIDLAQDKIIQECPMNVLDKGEEYPTYPDQPEPEPLLIDYHLQSVTVLRARFPTDGRSSYDGYDVVKVVDAPADVAGFEECLKQGAWNPADNDSDWKYEAASPKDYILYMLGEDGRGCVVFLYDDLESEHPQGGTASLAMYDAMYVNPAEFYRAIKDPSEFKRYWVSWDTYKMLYGMMV